RRTRKPRKAALWPSRWAPVNYFGSEVPDHPDALSQGNALGRMSDELACVICERGFKCPTRSTLQLRCRRTALRARRSRIRANADYRKALDPPPLKVGL